MATMRLVNWSMSTRSRDIALLIPLTQDQRKALERFADLEITIEELRRSLSNGVEFNFDGEHRTLTDHFEAPKPGVRVEKRQVENALDKKRRGQITEKELA